ncbi:hypothetical protein ACQKWADRAFT_285168 [Trichoderma austrokoningii]
MPRLEPIPEDEQAELESFPCLTRTEIDLVMARVLDSPCCPIYHNTPRSSYIQRVSQAAILSPQPRHGFPVQSDGISYPRHYSFLSTKNEYRPSYLSWPPVEFIKERTKARVDNVFAEWAIATTNMFGGVIPPASKYSVPPYALPSYDGQVRLRFIAECFSLPLSGIPADLEKLLSRNLFIVTCLVFNLVPNLNVIYKADDGVRYGLNVSRPDGKDYNETLLRAIQELEWTDPHLSGVVKLSMTDGVEALVSLFKRRAPRVMPHVSRMMDQMVCDEPELERLNPHKLHKMAVQQMRKDRPHSLLRNVVTPVDVVA